MHPRNTCLAPRADVDVTGTPCQSWSLMGKRKCESSYLMVAVLAWASWIRKTTPKVVIHENVLGFQVGILKDMLGDLYDIYEIRCHPFHASFALINRPRVYCILYLKKATHRVHDVNPMYDRLVRSMSSLGDASWSLIATSDELLAAENRARKRRNLQPTSALSNDWFFFTRRDDVSTLVVWMLGRLGAVWLNCFGLTPTPHQSKHHKQNEFNWSYLLTPKQQGYLQVYTAKWMEDHGTHPSDCASSCFDLSQNPAERAPPKRCKSTKLPTLKHSNNLLWFPRRKRWLLAKEQAASMGFPVYRARSH